MAVSVGTKFNGIVRAQIKVILLSVVIFKGTFCVMFGQNVYSTSTVFSHQ